MTNVNYITRSLEKDMFYLASANRVQYFKHDAKGVATMCRAMEEMRIESWQEGVEEGRKEGRKEGRLEGIHAIINVLREHGLTDSEIIQQLCKSFRLDTGTAEKMFHDFSHHD